MSPVDGADGTPPAPDEFEVTLIGPGVGECVVVHLGDGQWMVVDSCVVAHEPVALAYLRSIGVPPDKVTHLVVSHWHDDHHRGAAAVFKECSNATFCCSGALDNGTFRDLVALARPPGSTREFHELLTEIDRRSGGRRGTPGPKWMQAGIRLLYRAAGATPVIEVWALSPSADTVTRAHHDLARHLGLVPGARQAAANDCCVVIQVKFGGRSLLLGADLEACGDEGRGWKAVVDDHQVVGGRAEVYKVAHHGSHTGHDKGIFDALLHPGPMALVTPFRRSRLPAPSDLARLRAHASELHLTAAVSVEPPDPRSPAIDAAIDRVVRGRHREPRRPGRVRLRFRELGPISVEHSDGAFRVE